MIDLDLDPDLVDDGAAAPVEAEEPSAETSEEPETPEDEDEEEMLEFILRGEIVVDDEKKSITVCKTLPRQFPQSFVVGDVLLLGDEIDDDMWAIVNEIQHGLSNFSIFVLGHFRVKEGEEKDTTPFLNRECIAFLMEDGWRTTNYSEIDQEFAEKIAASAPDDDDQDDEDEDYGDYDYVDDDEDDNEE
jgi:hypothetical protein